MEPMEFIINATDEVPVSHTGLAPAGTLLGELPLRGRLNQIRLALRNHPSDERQHGVYWFTLAISQTNRNATRVNACPSDPTFSTARLTESCLNLRLVYDRKSLAETTPAHSFPRMIGFARSSSLSREMLWPSSQVIVVSALFAQLHP